MMDQPNHGSPLPNTRQLALGLLSGGIAAAIAGGVLWWIVNSMVRFNGVGWLAGLPWPLNQFWSFAAVGAVMGSVATAFAFARERRRTVEVAEMGQRLALDFSEQAPADGRVESPALKHWTKGTNRMRGDVGGVPVEVFDLTTVIPGSESSTTNQRTMVALRAEGLPEFDLRAQRGPLRWLSVFGLKGMAFDASGLAAAEREIVEQFSRGFIVTPTELATYFSELMSADIAPTEEPNANLPGRSPQDACSRAADKELPIRRLFTTTLMRACVERPGWSIESRGGQLTMWRGEGFQPAAARPGLLNEALELREALLRSAEQPDGPPLPAPTGQEPAARKAGMQGAGVGGVLGMIAGFFTGGGVASALFFQRPPGQFGGPAHWLEMLIPFGLAGLGAFGGARLGSFVARRRAARQTETPDDPDYARRKARNGTIGAMCGLVCGFFGGAIGGIVVGEAIGLGFDQFSLKSLLFFAGAGLGLAGGVLMGIWLGVTCTRRARQSRSL